MSSSVVRQKAVLNFRGDGGPYNKQTSRSWYRFEKTGMFHVGTGDGHSCTRSKGYWKKQRKASLKERQEVVVVHLVDLSAPIPRWWSSSGG